MKHFMLPRNPILRENHDAAAANNPNNASPNPKTKPTTPNPSARKLKPSKENAPPIAASDSNLPTSSPALKMKSPLPPRPPLKRKLSVEPVASDYAAPAGTSLDSGVKVIVRVRPPNKEEDGGNEIQKVTTDSLTISGQTFTFDSIADIHSKQSDIFELIGAPLIENCLAGFNSSVFAYGQTGSGKTYTIWGASNALLDEDQQGLAPRVFHRLFERINEEQVKQADRQLVYMCRCSFLEIYNEQITDLLDPSQKNLQIREDVKAGVYVENLREECASSMEDVSQLLIKGLSNRRTSATCVNSESSRSHSVFTCVVESRGKSDADGLSHMRMSRINFVDLAGSERQKQTGAAGERLKEAGNINRSLSQLGNLINILAEVSQTGKQRHIPYRDSKLTFLLQESLGGNSKLAMICAVSPSQSCKSETLSTLRFAQRAKAIKNKAVVNEEVQEDVSVLREVIRQLRDELHRMKANGNQTGQGGATGWNARRSLNLLRFSLNRPMMLPHAEDDSDEEMEIVDTEETMSIIPYEKCVSSPGQDCEDTGVEMEDETLEAVHESKIICTGAMERQLNTSHAKLEVALDDDSCGASGAEGDPLVAEKLPNDGIYGKQMEQYSPMQLSGVSENTPQKSTNIIGHGTATVSEIPTDLSPALKSPAPTISPRWNSNRKSLKTSSTAIASQSVLSQDNLKAKNESIAKPFNSVHVNSLSTRKSCFASSEQLAATLHRGLEIIESQRLAPALRRSAYRFSCMPADVKAVIPVVKVDVGIQTVSHGNESIENSTEEYMCSKCKTNMLQQELINDGTSENMQLVPVNESPLPNKCKAQVPKAVKKVLAGAIRREMTMEQMCAKQNSEIMQLNRLVQQYKHERECNFIIGQTREDKIVRLESLMDGVLPTEVYMEEEFLSLSHEHKILQKRYDNHPDVLRTDIELRRVQDELERYQNFFDLGERDVLLEEIHDLRTQLQFYLESSAELSGGQTPLLQLPSSSEPNVAPALSTSAELTENAEERLEQERILWAEAESKWISLVEELRKELGANESVAQRQRQELDMEKKCSEELKEAMQMAMEGHARMLEQYAELEEKHIELLARHRKIHDGVDDIKKAAARAGVKGAESRFINALAAEIAALKVEREKERQYFIDEIKGLKAQLRDTAEAVEAAGELLVRLKEAEETVSAAEKRALMAEQETENAYKEIEKLNKLLAASHMMQEEFGARGSHKDDNINQQWREEFCAWESHKEDNIDQQWQEEFAPSYGVGEEPSSWFSGYDRCNI